MLPKLRKFRDFRGVEPTMVVAVGENYFSSNAMSNYCALIMTKELKTVVSLVVYFKLDERRKV